MSDSIRLLHHFALYILLSQVIEIGVNLLTQMIRSPQPFRDILFAWPFLFVKRSNQWRSREENGARLRGSFARSFVTCFPRSPNKPPANTFNARMVDTRYCKKAWLLLSKNKGNKWYWSIFHTQETDRNHVYPYASRCSWGFSHFFLSYCLRCQWYQGINTLLHFDLHHSITCSSLRW